MDQLVHIIISGLEQLSRGGPLLIPLGIFSIWSHAIILERAYHLRRDRIIPSRFVTRSIYSELVRGNPEVAIKMCEKKPRPLTNILRSGIERRDAGEETLKRVVRLAMHTENATLTRSLDTLGMLAAIALYTGLLGTIIGLILCFRVLYTEGGQIGQPNDIAVGVSQALITTAAGLIVALPAFIAQHYFSVKAQRFLIELERHGMSLVRFLATEEYKLFQEEFEDIRELNKEGQK